jgi:hypothetical protein
VRRPRCSSSSQLVVTPAWSRDISALRMSRREMLGKRQVTAPLMAQRAAHGALRLAHRGFQPGESVSIQLAGLRLSGKPQRPSQCQFGHETLVLASALFAPAASRPGQHCAMRRQRGRQLAPCGHTSTVGQRFPRLVPRDDQEERRRTYGPALAERTPVPTVAAHVRRLTLLGQSSDRSSSQRHLTTHAAVHTFGLHRISDDAPEGDDVTTSAGIATSQYEELAAAGRGDLIKPEDPGYGDTPPPQGEQPGNGRRRWLVLAMAAQFLVILDL